MSVLEALAAGLPIISTDVGGLHDVVKGNGILCPDYDENALYYAMDVMLNEPVHKRQAQQNMSKNISKMYSSEEMAEKYTLCYKKITRK